jgi:aspartate kinase
MTLESVTIADELITTVDSFSCVAHVKIDLTNSSYAVSAILQELAKNNVSLELISIRSDQIMFTVTEDAVDVVCSNLKLLDCCFDIERQCAIVSISGGKVTQIPDLTANITGELLSQHIPLLRMFGSVHHITMLLPTTYLPSMVTILKDKFGIAFV